MDLTSAQLAGVGAAAAVGAVVALVLPSTAQPRLSRVRRRFTGLWAGGEPDVASLAAAQKRRLAAVAGQVDATRGDLEARHADGAQSLRHVAVLRYDAFGDMGGRPSFSGAAVDDAGDGPVISSIPARSESRTHAKGIVGGSSELTLTPKEQEALRVPRPGRSPRPGRTATKGRR